MKRRKFLVYSFLLGLGISFNPFTGMAGNEDGAIIIHLPESENHIRHGNFNLTKLSDVHYPNGVTNVRFQRFFKNGFVESSDDLCVVTFEFEGETHIVQFKFFELCEKGYINCESNGKSKNKIFRLI